MAQKIVLLSDLSGKEEAETLQFSVGADQYQIDLLPAELSKFLEVLKPYTDKATLRGSYKRPANGATPNPEAVRSWLQENGYEVSVKGRIPAALQAVYEKAHN